MTNRSPTPVHLSAVTRAEVRTVIDHLDRRLAETVEDIEASLVWQTVTSPATPALFVQEILKEIYLEIVMYQPDCVEAAIQAIGQMPRMSPAATDGMFPGLVIEYRADRSRLSPLISKWLSQLNALGSLTSQSVFG